MKRILILLAFVLTTPAFAGNFAYECKINGEYKQDENGKLMSDNKVYYGETFNVEKETGVVLGGGVGNSSHPTRQVLDPGGKEQAYKLIWISKDVIGTDGGKNVAFLTVYEYEDGISKPFILIEGSRVLTGLCE